MRNRKKKGSPIFVILISIIIGSLCGSIIANRMDNFSLDRISMSIEDFFAHSDKFFTNKIELFTSEFFKNAKVVIFIWIMAFIPFGKLFLLLLLFLKGLSYGFACSILFGIYKLKGALFVAKYILPPNFVLLAVFIFISVCNLNYAGQTAVRRKNDTQNFFEYFFVLTISLACIFLCGLIEIYFFRP